jgi:hypothetical protein
MPRKAFSSINWLGWRVEPVWSARESDVSAFMRKVDCRFCAALLDFPKAFAFPNGPAVRLHHGVLQVNEGTHSNRCIAARTLFSSRRTQSALSVLGIKRSPALDWARQLHQKTGKNKPSASAGIRRHDTVLSGSNSNSDCSAKEAKGRVTGRT